jgi:hypothetical protein
VIVQMDFGSTCGNGPFLCARPVETRTLELYRVKIALGTLGGGSILDLYIAVASRRFSEPPERHVQFLNVDCTAVRIRKFASSVVR